MQEQVIRGIGWSCDFQPAQHQIGPCGQNIHVHLTCRVRRSVAHRFILVTQSKWKESVERKVTLKESLLGVAMFQIFNKSFSILGSSH